MLSTLKGIASSTVTFWTTTALTCASQAASAAITIRLTTTDISRDHSIYAIALAASILDIVALASSLIAAFLYLRRTAYKVRLAICAACVLVAIVAALLTVYILAWCWNGDHDAQIHNGRTRPLHTLAEAGFAAWLVAVITQAILYILVLWPQSPKIAHIPDQELTEQRPSPVRSVKRSLSIHLGALAPPPPPVFLRSVSEPGSPALSSQTSSPRSSFRQSMGQAIRPMTSKTRLLLRQPYSPRDSRSFQSGRETSLDAIRHDQDGFENWDTSSVEDANNENFERSTRNRLETIPGSRPVSPAKPLDGPFPDEVEPEDILLPESPLHSPLQSPTSETSSLRLSSPADRRESNADQSHIHPLFRTESPVPPPLASPNTVIVASPYAGQVVSSEHLVPRRLHSSHSNRPESPLSPRSRQNSFRSLRIQPSSPVPQSSGSFLASDAARGTDFGD